MNQLHGNAGRFGHILHIDNFKTAQIHGKGIGNFTDFLLVANQNGVGDFSFFGCLNGFKHGRILGYRHSDFLCAAFIDFGN